MTPIEKDKIIALCERWGLRELNLTRGVFIAEDNTGITVNLRGDNPVVGVTIAGELHTEGHGNLKVEDYQREVETIIKSSSKKNQSLSTEQERPGILPVGGMEATHPKKLGTPDNLAPPAKVASLIASGEPETQGNKTADSHSAGATKLQKAKCKECKIEFEITLDEAKNIFEEYDGIYCLKCRTKGRTKVDHEKKETKNEKKEGDNKIMETQIEKIVRMDEKLPPKINEDENKLTMGKIKQYICPTATDAEAYNFLQLCVHRDLNPFLKEAYLIKYGNAPATMVVGKDAFIRKAAESGQYDGFEAGIIIKTSDGRIERRVGVIQYEGDILVGGWAKVFRKDMKYPFVCEVPLNEYMKFKDGKPQSSWAIMPGTMIRKVAVVQGHREAFAKELGGCYDAVEHEIRGNGNTEE